MGEQAHCTVLIMTAVKSRCDKLCLLLGRNVLPDVTEGVWETSTPGAIIYELPLSSEFTNSRSVGLEATGFSQPQPRTLLSRRPMLMYRIAVRFVSVLTTNVKARAFRYASCITHTHSCTT